MTQISPLPGKVVVAAPTESSGSVSEISTNVSSAVSGANVRYRQGKHSSKQWMQAQARMVCSGLLIMMWPCLVNLNEGDEETSSTSYAIIYISMALVLALF